MHNLLCVALYMNEWSMSLLTSIHKPVLCLCVCQSTPYIAECKICTLTVLPQDVTDAKGVDCKESYSNIQY